MYHRLNVQLTVNLIKLLICLLIKLYNFSIHLLGVCLEKPLHLLKATLNEMFDGALGILNL